MDDSRYVVSLARSESGAPSRVPRGCVIVPFAHYTLEKWRNTSSTWVPKMKNQKLSRDQKKRRRLRKSPSSDDFSEFEDVKDFNEQFKWCLDDVQHEGTFLTFRHHKLFPNPGLHVERVGVVDLP